MLVCWALPSRCPLPIRFHTRPLFCWCLEHCDGSCSDGERSEPLPFRCYLGASSERVLKLFCSFLLLVSSPFLSIYNLFCFLHFCSSPMRATWCDQHIGSLKIILMPSCHLTCFPFNLAHGYGINMNQSYTLSSGCEKIVCQEPIVFRCI